jgi:DNA repair photolyase
MRLFCPAENYQITTKLHGQNGVLARVKQRDYLTYIQFFMKTFNSKAIYNPSGKAGEYSYWACNFYVGCSNGCIYCYCKKGILAGAMGQDKPQLKKCFKDEIHAMEVFEKELLQNKTELQKHGIFFSFTTDPMIEETYSLTVQAVRLCNSLDIPVNILTKETGYIYKLSYWTSNINTELIAIGFTLTGHDELEPNVSTNAQRIRAMELCKQTGYHTFASIEPIIDFPSAKNVINASIDFCDLYKVGLMSGKKYDVVEAQSFVEWLNGLNKPKIYLKESLQKLSRYTNDELDEYFVNRDYRLH